MDVRIYQPAKNAMQSGRAKTQRWVLEGKPDSRRDPEPLMGWVSSGDTNAQVKLYFPSAAEAVSFAQGKGWAYTVDQPHERRVMPRNYVDNFRYIPVEEGK